MTARARHLCVALFYSKGFAGLADGLHAYLILLQRYWHKGLYPLKKRERANSVILLDKQLAKGINTQIPEFGLFPSEIDTLQEIKEIAERIKDFMNAKLPGHTSWLEELRAFVDRSIADCIEEES